MCIQLQLGCLSALAASGNPEDLYSLLWWIGLWIVGGGALGGLASLFVNTKFRNGKLLVNDEVATGRDFLLYVLSAILVGVSAAVAVQFLFIAMRSFPEKVTAEKIVYGLSISTLAGFAARSILTRMSDGLAEKAAALVEKHYMQDVKKEIISDVEKRRAPELMKQKERDQLQMALEDSAGRAYKDQIIDMLKEKLADSVNNVELLFPLTRLLKERGNYQEAAEYCTKYLRERDKTGIRDRDYADALYNRACYCALLYRKMKKDTALRVSIFSDLMASIELFPDNKKYIKVEEDFKELRTSAEFKKLIK